MPFKYSLEGFVNPQIPVGVKDIAFPPSEVETLKKQTRIVTHRVSDDATRFEKDDLVYARQIDENYCFKVESIQLINSIEKSPYFKELTAGQVTYLRKFDKIAVLTLSKTQYERPYDLKTIKAKYPPEIYERLRHDPVHWWRAVTGIDMIHLEPDDSEQKRTCGNWRMLPDPYKKVSDEKSLELFGYTNLDHEKILPIDRLKKIFSMIHYGTRNPKTGMPFRTKEEFGGKSMSEVWRLATPDQTISAECGNCYDTVAISLAHLSATKIKYAHFFMTGKDSGFMETHTHTFIIYQDPIGEWRWLEGSWQPFVDNNWHTRNAIELVKRIGVAEANIDQRPIEIHSLKGYPKYGCNMETFERYCRSNPIVLVCEPERK